MKRSEIFIVNQNSDPKDIKVELTETLNMVESSLVLLQNELLESISCPYQNGFLQILLNQMQSTVQLYRTLYEPAKVQINKNEIFLINPIIEPSMVQTELVASIHQLQSLCFFAAYKFLDDLDSDMVNSFTVINKYMLRAVKLIDLLELHRNENSFAAA
ncbi:MAG: hypothetical protein HKM04_10120 [Legionellales bacterium]|nr:hypothetical protein [Legionellales bacterium]